MESKRERLESERRRGRGEEGVVAGMSVVYKKWISMPALAPVSMSGPAKGGGGDGENGGGVIEGIGMSTQK